MSKLLTIITATYNKGDRNRASIQSILDQTHRDFEYIVINDGSPDNTRQILSEFDDPRLKIVHQENQGFVKTMIATMELVKTPYVAIQGAGDISLPERLEKQLRWMKKRPDVGVVCGLSQQINDSEFDPSKGLKAAFKQRQVDTIEFNDVQRMIKTNIANHGEVMIRTKAYQKAGGYRSFFRYAQDRDLWLRLLENFSMVRLGEPIYIKVTDAKFDVYGNPCKAEEQALYSLFSRYLARQRLQTGKDPLEEEGAKSFEFFVQEALSDSDKEEIIGRVFRNTLSSEYGVDEAIKIIQKYAPKHHYIRLLRILKFMSSNVPYGGRACYWYYHNLELQALRVTAKLSKLAAQSSRTSA